MRRVLSFGDVLLVPFPFTDQQGSKQRPAVVVSSCAYNANRPDVLMMAITSAMRLPNAHSSSSPFTSFATVRCLP